MASYKPGLVSIIIPTIPRKKLESLKTLVKKRFLLEDCLRELKKNVTLEHEIILLVNGEEDPKFVGHCRALGADKSIVTSTNCGVPRAWNMGAQMAVEVGPGGLEGLLEVLKDPSVGEVGPSGNDWYRKKPGVSRGLTQIEEAEVISGFLFMTKRTVFDQVGGFDPWYTPAFMEEIDYSFAVRGAGHRCLVVPGLDIQHHHISGASSTNRPIRCLGQDYDRWEITFRNQAHFEEKWAHLWNDPQRETP